MFAIDLAAYDAFVHPSPPPGARSTRDRPAKSPLSERAVLDAAVRVLRDEGLEAVSMRRVAKELDTGAASLYAYVRNRDELHDLVFEDVTGTIPLPQIAASSWREDLRALLVATRAVLLAHPGLARVALARVPTRPNSLAVADVMMGLMQAGGVDSQRAAWAIDNLFLIVTADAVESDIERELAEQGEGKAIDHEAIHAVFTTLPPERFPYLARFAEQLTSGDGDVRFLFAIDTYLAGILAG